ncbi:glycosyltransferase [Mangrovimonas sp. ST2L15]|uniref:glycosyltransferase n=1 Tax=Mangrovimonas sp. ST2L15 TaxID=1645916 RepID=UPI0006B6502D|nr:glycosyltransferase [Mangrovimonas sp. ST2L15]
MKKSENSANYLILPKLDDDENRPVWSVVIPTYNCAHFLRETLQSVLSQDLGPKLMQIIVVDDFSTKDDPEAVVKEIGKGRVEFFRQESNVGKVKNYETGLLKSKGKLIHLLHGDDKLLYGFYSEMTELFEKYEMAKAAFCRSIYIDANSNWKGLTGMVQEKEGIVNDLDEKLYLQQLIQTPSMVVKREVYETIGAFDRSLDCMEDWEMWFRISNNYPIAISNKVLAEYRIHSNNATNETFLNGSALRTHDEVLKMMDSYVPLNKKNKSFKSRNKKQADFLLLSYRNIKHSLTWRERKEFIARILKLNSSLRMILGILR